MTAATGVAHAQSEGPVSMQTIKHKRALKRAQNALPSGAAPLPKQLPLPRSLAGALERTWERCKAFLGALYRGSGQGLGR